MRLQFEIARIRTQKDQIQKYELQEEDKDEIPYYFFIVSVLTLCIKIRLTSILFQIW